MTVFVANGTSGSAWATVPLCKSSGNVNTNGFTVSGWVNASNADTPSTLGFINAEVWTPNDTDGCGLSNSSQLTVMDKWYQVSCAFTSSHVIDWLSIVFNPATFWSGTLYLDDFTITGP